MKLHDVKEGSPARVLAVTGDARFVSRVTAVGLTEGCHIEVLQNVRKRPVAGIRPRQRRCDRQRGLRTD